MKKELNNILHIWNEIKILQNEKNEKENTILSCLNLIEKGIDLQEIKNLKQRQYGVSVSLIELNNKLVDKIDILGEILKGISNESLIEGKISFDLLSTCMYNKISREDLKIIKEVYKSYSEEKYLDIPKNQKLGRVGKVLKEFFNKK